jgi:hypothetical protein
MTQKQESTDLDAEMVETAERINRTIDSMIADLRRLKLEFNRKLKQKPKR